MLLPLSEAAEYLSDTSTCQQAPGTSSTDAADPFFQPERSARTFSPFSHIPTLSVADGFTQPSPASSLTLCPSHCSWTCPSPAGLTSEGTQWHHWCHPVASYPAAWLVGAFDSPCWGHGQRNQPVPQQVHSGCPPQTLESLFVLLLIQNKLLSQECHLNLD